MDALDTTVTVVTVADTIARCRQRILDASGDAMIELETVLRQQHELLQEQQLDNQAMKEWGSRVEARRVASAIKDAQVKETLTKRINELLDANSLLHEEIACLRASAIIDKKEMCRLSEEALETCNVSRTVMLQNMHTQMEIEIKSLRSRLVSCKTV